MLGPLTSIIWFIKLQYLDPRVGKLPWTCPPACWGLWSRSFDLLVGNKKIEKWSCDTSARSPLSTRLQQSNNYQSFGKCIQKLDPRVGKLPWACPPACWGLWSTFECTYLNSKNCVGPNCRRRALITISFESGVLWAHNQVQTVFPFSGDGVLGRQRM